MSFAKNLVVFFWEFFETIIVSLAIFLVLYMFVFQPHQVNGLSMYPTLQDKEYLLTNKFIYRFNLPSFGDIIVFQAPNHEEYDYIKRIIGLPGDKIKLTDGNFLVNGAMLDESTYLSSDVYTGGENFLKEGQEVVVPADNYFVAGDNRSNSSDSRNFGFVPKKNIVGRAWISYWPLNRIGIIKHYSDLK